eukprot:TRINITY_DN3873_c0_g1_i1.p3 TRINITY_DN3873_c0_g1~~TRINITY_DN3873_c0_g1_i1.p3  ORF type:complete len:116 (+),score=16.26 TRINITY_DN3873_c0_g1_i1:666-1013(+)
MANCLRTSMHNALHGHIEPVLSNPAIACSACAARWRATMDFISALASMRQQRSGAESRHAETCRATAVLRRAGDIAGADARRRAAHLQPHMHSLLPSPHGAVTSAAEIKRNLQPK